MRTLAALLLLLAGAAAAGFLFYRPTPRYAVGQLAAAVATRDTAAIERWADTRAVSAAFAAELGTTLADRGGRLAGRLGGSPRDSAEAARVLRALAGAGDESPYLIAMGEQMLWTAISRADTAPAVLAHAAAVQAAGAIETRGDTAFAVVPLALRLPELRIDTTVRARLVFAQRPERWTLVAIRDLAGPALAVAMRRYLRESGAVR